VRLELDERPLHRAFPADLAVLVVPSDGVRALGREPSAGPEVVRELARRGFKGDVGSGALIAAGSHGVRRDLAVLGLGEAASAGREAYRRAGTQLVQRAREARARSAAVAVLRPATALAGDTPDALGLLAEGALLASYAFDVYRHERDRPALRRVVFTGVAAAHDRALRRALRDAEALAGATNRARTWINEPAAHMTPAVLADEAVRAARAAGLEARAEGPKAIARHGMGALLAVAKGSVEEPRFIRVVYRPLRTGDGGARRHVALVGKGITFDSGGLSLKTGGGMEHMKRDMAGGAAVLGAMLALAALRPPLEVRAYVPACENLPGEGAMKPGDVLRTAAGRTVEVLNTDAEGRLVLADALALAVRERPAAVVDIATLTGAVRSALGTRLGGVMGTDRELVRELIDAGADTGERLWELPLVAAYRDDLESPIADLRNVAAGGYGGAIHAGLFLREFVGDRPWAHLDVAGVAFTDRDLPGTPRGGVGFGVRLLARWACGFAAHAERTR